MTEAAKQDKKVVAEAIEDQVLSYLERMMEKVLKKKGITRKDLKRALATPPEA